MKKTNRLSQSTLVKTLALLVILVVASLDISSTWQLSQNQDELALPGSGLFLAFYFLFLLAGLVWLLLGLWTSTRLDSLRQKIHLPTLVRWLAWTGLLLAYTWGFLFSPWQALLTGPWSGLLFSLGLAQLLLFFAPAGRSQELGWGELLLALTLFVYPPLVQEIRDVYATSLASRLVSAAGLGSIAVLLVFLYESPGQRLRPLLLRVRARLGIFRWALAGLFLLTPLFLRLAVSEMGYFGFVNVRFLLSLLALCVTAYLSTREPDRLVSLPALGFCLGALLLVSRLVYVSFMVVDYPFSLSWSEGNRLYDFSLKFGQSLYNYEGTIIYPYGSPGRYLLWEAAFLWKGLPLWAHRLWNQLIYLIPPFVLSAMLAHKFQPRALRMGITLGAALVIILLAPPHPPFVLIAILSLVFFRHKSPWLRGAALLAASYYALYCRFTWVIFPSVAGVLVDLLLHYPQRTGKFFKRILPTLFLAVVGYLPGGIPNLTTFINLARNYIAPAASGGQADASSWQQPLLWYRLWPNEPLGPGILLQTLLVAGPWLILLAWWMFSRRWKLDWVQITAIWGALAGFLGVGIVVSMKIGGGSDLHNLDMFFMALLFVIVTGWRAQRIGMGGQEPGPEKRTWPPFAVGLAVFSVMLMVYPLTLFSPSASSSPRAVPLPGPADVEEVLDEIRSEVERALPQGEVLFMDQRQLLAFGYVPAIPFVDEYEKKFVMDMAMASNAEYFQAYYQDLANRRFSLIITEPLRINYQGDTHIFGDENDAWVQWVSEPTLCFYEPVDQTNAKDRVAVMLLVPRADTRDCARFLEQEEK